MTEFLPGMDVRKMNLNGWQINCRDGISECHTGVGIGGGIQNDDVELAPRFLNPIDQLALDIRLPEFNFRFELRGPFTDPGLDVRQCRPPINLRLPLAEEVEVGAVEE